MVSSDEHSFHDNDVYLNLEDQDEPNVLPCHAWLPKQMNMTKICKRVPKSMKRSRYGISYSSLPFGVTKRVASTCIGAMEIEKKSISKESLKAIMNASDRYFKQISEDLSAFSHHAGRKRIDEIDMIAVMKRYVAMATT